MLCFFQPIQIALKIRPIMNEYFDYLYYSRDGTPCTACYVSIYLLGLGKQLRCCLSGLGTFIIKARERRVLVVTSNIKSQPHQVCHRDSVHMPQMASLDPIPFKAVAFLRFLLNRWNRYFELYYITELLLPPRHKCFITGRLLGDFCYIGELRHITKL